MLGTYALSAGYYDAFYLKAQKVRTLIKRDFDLLWEAGFDALVAPTSPYRRLAVRGADGGPGPDVPRRRLHAAGEHGRACPGSRSRAACPRACPVGLQLIGAAWSEAALFRAARAYEGVTAGAVAGRQPRTWMRSGTRRPTPAERMGAGA